MKADQLLAAIRKAPFRSFVIHTGSGESYPVKHPENCSISIGGRTAGVWLNEVDQAILDVESITELVAGPSSRRTKGDK